MAVDIANLLSAKKYVASGSEKLKRRGPQNNDPKLALIQSSLNSNTTPRVRYRLNDPTPPTQVFIFFRLLKTEFSEKWERTLK